MIHFRRLTLLFLFGLVNPLFSQHIGYKQYTVADGLVQSEVTYMHQDKKGFLWIGTKMGINRFDGQHFEIVADTNGISASWVFYINEINDSTVWFLTAKGCVLYVYGKQDVTVRSYPVDGHFIIQYVKDGKGYFANQSKELYQIDLRGVKYIRRPFFDRIKGMFRENTWVELTYAPQTGYYYFRTKEDKLACVSGTDVTILPLTSFDRILSGSDGEVYCMAPCQEMKQYFSGKTENSWKSFSDKPSEPIRIFRLRDTTATCVANFGMNKGLLDNFLYILNQDTMIFISPDKPLFSIMKQGKLQDYRTSVPLSGSAFSDREKNLWIGSPLGLLKIFSLGIIHYGPEDGLHTNLQIIGEDKNHDMVTGGFHDGLQIIRHDRVFNLPMPTFTGSRILTQVYPGCGKDKNGHLYLSITPLCMIGWNGSNLHTITGLPFTSAYSFFEDTATGLQYIGANGGVIKRKPPDTTIQVLPVFPGNKGNKVVSMVKDQSGRLFLGGFKGLSWLEGDKVTHLPSSEFPYNHGANAMAKDHQGNIWLGNTEGLWHFDMKTFRKVKNPWFNDLITSLCFIDSTKLFIGGLRGIGFLDLAGFYLRDTAIIRYFNAENGFTGNECQQNAVCLDSRGFLWVATTENLLRIDQANLPPAGTGPDAYIEKISLIDESMKIVPLLKSSVSSGNYHLNYPGRNLRFDFCAPVFRNPSLVRYRYRLEGYDLQWSPPTRERYAVYTNLTPGKYTFNVIACNDAGIWSPNPARFSIVIHPAFWQTWWFRILVPVLFAIVFFFFGFLVRNQRRKQEQEKLETEKRMAELQLISIRNQIDPHFTFNAMNAIASVIMKEEKEKAYSFFVKLSTLIRQVLTSGDKITRTLADELLFVKNYLEIEKLRFRESFDFEIIIADGVNLEQEVPKMVVQTYAENSLKHGLLNKKEGIGNLMINVHEESGNLHITVEDNGIGREAARAIGSKSTGKGMKILNHYYDFFDRYNKQKIHHEVTDLYDECHQPAGTRINVIIPSGFNFQSTTHATH